MQNTNTESERKKNDDLAIKICVLRNSMNDQPKHKQNKLNKYTSAAAQPLAPESILNKKQLADTKPMKYMSTQSAFQPT